jgi:hypothetical protein
MLKGIGTGLLLTLFVIAVAYGFVLVIRNMIDCMPDPNDEED